jgi:hypothetical protein
VKEKGKARGKKIVVDAVISTAVYLQSARDMRVKSQVLGHVILRLERKIGTQLTYKSGQFSWAKKEYVGGECPATHAIEPQASPRDYAKFMEVVQQKSAQVKTDLITSAPPAAPPVEQAKQPSPSPLIQEIQQYTAKPTPSNKLQPPFHIFEER